MDKPTNDEIENALKQRAKYRHVSPLLADAFDTMNQYRVWADAELKLATAQEKHLAQKIVEQRAQLTSLEHLRYNHDQAVRERSFVSQELADANEKIRVLQADVAKGQREFDRRLKAKDARIEEVERALSDAEDDLNAAGITPLRQENERLTTNLIDARRRDIAKGAEITKLRAARDQAVNLQEALTTDLGEANHDRAMLRAENDKLRNANARLSTKACDSCGKSTNRIDQPRTAEEQQVQLDEMIAALNAATPKGKSYADAELGVIQDCLEALERIPATQRAAVTQYLTSRAHTAAWGTMPVPQHPAF
jgi:chromosome segregation ATPase